MFELNLESEGVGPCCPFVKFYWFVIIEIWPKTKMPLSIGSFRTVSNSKSVFKSDYGWTDSIIISVSLWWPASKIWPFENENASFYIGSSALFQLQILFSNQTTVERTLYSSQCHCGDQPQTASIGPITGNRTGPSSSSSWITLFPLCTQQYLSVTSL